MSHKSVVGPGSFLFFTSRLLGQFPYDSRGQPCVTSALYSVALAAVAACTTVYLTFFTSYFHSKSVLTGFLNRAELLALQATGTWCSVAALVGGGRRGRLVRQLDNIRALVQPLRQTAFPKSKRNLIHLANLVWIFQAFFSELKTSGKYSLNIAYVFGCHSANIIVYLMVAQYRSYLDVLKEYTRSLCDALAECTDERTVFQPGLKQKLSRVQSATYAYNLICKSCLRVNRMYDVQIFLTITLVALILSENAYILNNDALLILKGGRKDLSFFKELVFWLTWWASIVWRIVNSSVTIQNEANKFNKILYKLMIEDKSKELTNNVKLRLHMIVKKEIKLTAGGFLPLDYTLIHSMAAAVTTYFIILLQFSPPEKE